MTSIVTMLFVLLLTFTVPVVIGVVMWRSIRRVLKNAGLPANATELSKLRDLIAQARGQPSGGSSAVANAAVAASPSTASTAPRSTQGPVVMVKSLGSGLGVVAIVFSVIGSIAAAVAVTTGWSQHRFLSDVVSAEGEVIRNVRRGGNKSGAHPVVRFQPGGGEPIEFEGPIGNSPAQFAVGERVTVLYPPGRPEDAKIDNWIQLWFAPMLSGFFVLVFGGMGIGFMIPFLLQRGRMAWAREQGTQTRARFAHAVIDRTTRINGRSPYKVFADWRNPVDNKTYRFQSQKALWFDPTAQLYQRPDIPLRVDPQDPKRYWLDLSHLRADS